VTLVDSNVLIDLFIDDPRWSDWSLARLQKAVARGPVFINDIIYSESSTRYESVEDFEAALATIGVKITPVPRLALFLAGKAFVQHRNAGGPRTGVLPDFFIGAHAAVESFQPLTRDTRHYRTYFPTVKLIAPGSTRTPKRKGPQLALEPLDGAGIAGYVPEP
jgi:predicted nucleic acid-binding protein